MLENKLRSSVICLLVCFVSACAISQKQGEDECEPIIVKNDYPTRDRVEYVMNCIAQHGGLTYITQYACGCKIDKIAEKLTFEEYDAAKTFSFLKSTAGESGGVFRDPRQSKDLREKLKEAEAFAESGCFVK